MSKHYEKRNIISNPYPTNAELERISSWDSNDIEGLMDCIWDYFQEHGWAEKTWMYYSISTGGWSGCEDIISAIRGNTMIWMMHWYQSRRGGHYKFLRPEIYGKPKPEAPSNVTLPY